MLPRLLLGYRLLSDKKRGVQLQPLTQQLPTTRTCKELQKLWFTGCTMRTQRRNLPAAAAAMLTMRHIFGSLSRFPVCQGVSGSITLSRQLQDCGQSCGTNNGGLVVPLCSCCHALTRTICVSLFGSRLTTSPYLNSFACLLCVASRSRLLQVPVWKQVQRERGKCDRTYLRACLEAVAVSYPGVGLSCRFLTPISGALHLLHRLPKRFLW